MRLAAAISLIILLLLAAVTARAEEDSDMAKASALFVSVFRGRCADHAFDGRQETPERYDITYRDTGAKPKDPDKQMILFEFFCDNFAHAGSAAFIQKGNDGAFSVVSFSMPVSDMTPDPADAGRLIITGLLGFSAQDTLRNADFDAETLSISTSDHVGNDEYFSTWVLSDGLFLFAGDQTWTVKGGRLARTSAEGEE